ncbi:hypothetical protein B0H19DRAFT_1078823 [Mycena capillaripes]|nr:hypothetical protein B0H19DRAFT_1078823 [Mycena capillaripes]
MPPLTRQQTHASVHSWWSDSNPGLQGPTVNIHAAAKPLMKLMYHRQALAFIRKNRSSPLSRTILETFLSYLPWDYISRFTKEAIFGELIYRTTTGVDDARAMVDSPVFDCIVQMKFGGPRVQYTRHLETENMGAAGVPLAASVGSFLFPGSHLWVRDEDYTVVAEATYALSRIARWLDGAQAIVDAKALDKVTLLLNSPGQNVRKWVCLLVGTLACHEPITHAIFKLKPCVRLVALLRGKVGFSSSNRDEDSEVIEWAMHALSQIAHGLEGVQAIVQMSGRYSIPRIGMSLNGLARHGLTRIIEFTRPVLGFGYLDELHARFLLISAREPSTRTSAIFALCAISERPDAVMAFADLDLLEKLQNITSTDTETQVQIHTILNNLAQYMEDVRVAL